MALTSGTNTWSGDIEISKKQSNILLETAGKYVDRNISLTINLNDVTHNVSSLDQTSVGNVTTKAVVTSGITNENIKKNSIVKVGDSDNPSKIIELKGTFTSADTVSSGQSAAYKDTILNGYSAWVDGDEVKGNVPIYSNEVTLNNIDERDNRYLLYRFPYGYYDNATLVLGMDSENEIGLTFITNEQESIIRDITEQLAILESMISSPSSGEHIVSTINELLVRDIELENVSQVQS